MSHQRHTSLLVAIALSAGMPACGGDDSPKPQDSDASHQAPASDAGHDNAPAADASHAASDASAAAADAGPAVPQVSPTTSALVRSATPSSANVKALGASNRAFAFDLYHQIANGSDGQNLLFSPYSISTALAMTYAGARGTTESEMKSTLHFDLPDAQLHEAFNATDLALASRGQGQVGADGMPFRLRVDNSLWTQSNPQFPPVPAFLDTLALNYGAGLFLLDFIGDPDGARGKINDWVAIKTEQLIPQLLPAMSITNLTRFVITNTVYFNASWQQKFDPKLTTDGPFTKLDGSQITASMMHDDLNVSYASGDGYQAVALPYASNELKFVAILPNDGQHAKIEAGLNGAWFDALDAAWGNKYVRLTLPKLDYQAQASLADNLEALGMKAAFTDGADFSGISAESPLEISAVIHKAVIKVIENGTIAAAATAVIGATTASLPPTPIPVAFDRPFFIAIYDTPTGSLLFVGRVLDPSAK